MIDPIYLRNEWLIQSRQLGHHAQLFLFLLISASLFPLAIGPEQSILYQIAPGIIWVLVLLSMTQTLNNLLTLERDHGVLDQLLLSNRSLELFIFIKLLCAWLFNALAWLFVMPLIAFSFGLSWIDLKVLWITLLLGTPTLIFIGGTVRALTLSMRRPGLLLILLTLPLYIPVLMTATSAINIARDGLSIAAYLAWLGIYLLLALLLTPFTIANILRYVHR